MPRTNPTYPPEFRREAIRLVRASDEDHPIPKVAREIGVCDVTLLDQAARDLRREGEGLTTEEKEELRKLGGKVKTLWRQENELLRKAAAFCRMLRVSKSGYYAWRDRQPSKRNRQDALLNREDPRDPSEKPRNLRLAEGACRATFARGYLRRQEGRSVNEGCGSSGLHKRTEAKNHSPRSTPVPDLLHRNFVTGQPNKIWLADIT